MARSAPYCAMYTLRRLGWPRLGGVFALLTALAAFGIGNMVQANSVAQSLQASFGFAPPLVGGALVVVAGAVILGGIRRIAAFAEILVPFMAILYLAGGLAVVLTHPEGVDADLVGQDCLLDDVAQHLVVGEQLAFTVDGHVAEGVETEFELRHG